MESTSPMQLTDWLLIVLALLFIGLTQNPVLTALLHGITHGLMSHIDTKAICRHLKNCPVKGLGGSCLSVWGPETHTLPPFTHCVTYIQLRPRRTGASGIIT
jgi:hypothetical protein